MEAIRPGQWRFAPCVSRSQNQPLPASSRAPRMAVMGICSAALPLGISEKTVTQTDARPCPAKGTPGAKARTGNDGHLGNMMLATSARGVRRAFAANPAFASVQRARRRDPPCRWCAFQRPRHFVGLIAFHRPHQDRLNGIDVANGDRGTQQFEFALQFARRTAYEILA